MNLAALLFDATLPSHTAVVDPDRSISYPQLRADILDLAGALQSSGVRAGDVVGIQLPNGIDFARSFFAVLAAGAVATPLGTHLSDKDAAAQLREAGAQLALRSGADIAALVEQPHTALANFAAAREQDLACLPFSSGTTGAPKAVELTHGNLCANVLQFAERVGIAAGETCLSMLPLSHIYGLTALLTVPLYCRARVVTAPFSAMEFLRNHERWQVNTTFIAPPLARLLAQHPVVDEIDFSHCTQMISGAASLPSTIARAAMQRTGVPIRQGYGLTEASPVTHLCVAGSPLNSIGPPLRDTQQRIVDPLSLQERELGEVGELWVAGPQVMRGYSGAGPDSYGALVDGWLRTGDMAYANDRGEVFIVDRLKDIIKSHGFQVSPVKLEEIVLGCPGVLDCAVVSGVGDDGEEMPVACVVADDSGVEAAALMRFVAERVAPFERIRQVRFVESIPRSAAGKTLRRVLRS
ncbi:class I adenylate-forming enzyme family protein [Corynebacterium sp. 11A]|uniref:class I adenylate-forming enzyme family protein n=1 Tax=Corynebacterium sp. 11A TaxID=2080510 RepID=UPI00124E243E|nr:AMP-binding protein [Corynebacterium sp. 11A]